MSRPQFAPGVRVRIICGPAKGIEGVIAERWPIVFERGCPSWLVESDDLIRKRVMRADFLEVVPEVAS